MQATVTGAYFLENNFPSLILRSFSDFKLTSESVSK